ncbi:unnamed protein product [Cylindrotheca closterium]|uniref:Protein kinase domain-containing protein n=1 Tax=Cylindrotheca closterium TaxID=2856 RepID=A0AAD2CS96_9STRA|nr:unnamed protein product [Cylindrotheca closterium]
MTEKKFSHSPYSTVENWDQRKKVWKSLSLLSSDTITLQEASIINVQSMLKIAFDAASDTSQHHFIQYMQEWQTSLEVLQSEMKEVQIAIEGVKMEQEELKIEKGKLHNEEANHNEESGKLHNEEANHNEESASIENCNDEASETGSLSQKRKLIELTRQVMEEKKGRLEEKKGRLEEKKGKLEEKKGRLILEADGTISAISSSHQNVQTLLNWHATLGNETKSKSTQKSSTNKYDSRGITEAKKQTSLFSAELHQLLSLEPPSAPGTDEAASNAGDDLQMNHVNKIVTTILDSKFLNDGVGSSFQKLEIRHLKETTVAQPILHALMYRVLDIVGLRSLYVSKEQRTRGQNGGESDRIMDFLVHEIREHILFALPSMIEGIVEVKKCGKDDSEDEKLIDLAVKQIVGNFAKRLRVEFNFLGIGADCELYGVAMSLSKISIVKASLQNVGTDQVGISWSKTTPVGLLSEDGLELLALALSASYTLSQVKHDIATLEAKKVNGRGRNDEITQICIKECLGFGAFGIVYKVLKGEAFFGAGTGTDTDTDHAHQHQSRYFLKIPSCHGASVSLKDEAETLSRLNESNKGKGKVPHIPSCMAEEIFDINFNGFVGETSGLLLNGMIGKPTNSVNWKLPPYDKGLLESVMRKVHATLTAAHESHG